MKKITNKRKNKKKNRKKPLIYLAIFALVATTAAILLVAVIKSYRETPLGEIKEYWGKFEKIDPELFRFEIIAIESDGKTSKLKIKFRDIVFDSVCEWRHSSDLYSPMANYCTTTLSTGDVISKYSPLGDFERILWYLHKDQVLALSDKYPMVIKASEYPGIDTDVDSLFVVEDESELKSFTNDVLEIEDYDALYEYLKASYKVGRGSFRDYDYSGISIINKPHEPYAASQTIFECAFNNT